MGVTPAPPPAAVDDTMARPLRDLRISVTDRCNFRCPYCMPAEVYGDRYQFLARSQILTFEEVDRLARCFVATGARKLRLTGGEPLLRAQLPRLVARLAAIDGVEDLALTTNGSLLAGAAPALAVAGLRRVTVSLDSLDDAVFKAMAGRTSATVATVLAGIGVAAAAGLRPVKVNCVVRRGANDHTVVDLARHFQGTGHIVRFIEFMDVGTLNGWGESEVVTAREIVERIDAELPLEPLPAHYRGEVANRFRYRDGSGEIGVIAAVSDPFCGDCTRARLSTEGRLVTCLFAASGVDLATPLRSGASDDDLLALIRGTWAGRADRYSEERAAARRRDRRPLEMFQLGG